MTPPARPLDPAQVTNVVQVEQRILDAVADAHVAMWFVDPVDSSPLLAEVAVRHAPSLEEASVVLKDLIQMLGARLQSSANAGRRWAPSADEPLVLVVIDAAESVLGASVVGALRWARVAVQGPEVGVKLLAVGEGMEELSSYGGSPALRTSVRIALEDLLAGPMLRKGTWA